MSHQKPWSWGFIPLPGLRKLREIDATRAEYQLEELARMGQSVSDEDDPREHVTSRGDEESVTYNSDSSESSIDTSYPPESLIVSVGDESPNAAILYGDLPDQAILALVLLHWFTSRDGKKRSELADLLAAMGLADDAHAIAVAMLKAQRNATANEEHEAASFVKTFWRERSIVRRDRNTLRLVEDLEAHQRQRLLSDAARLMRLRRESVRMLILNPSTAVDLAADRGVSLSRSIWSLDLQGVVEQASHLLDPGPIRESIESGAFRRRLSAASVSADGRDPSFSVETVVENLRSAVGQ